MTAEDEREIRERLVELQQTLQALASRAGELFQTNGWIRTADEPPPYDLRVLGVRFGDVMWFTRRNGGDSEKWTVDYMNGTVREERGRGPDFWMVLPPTPEEGTAP